MDYVAVAARCLLAFVFLASVAGKLRNRGSFRAFESSLRLLARQPRWSVRPLAVLVVGAEAAVPALLVVPGAGTVALVVAAAALAVFTVAIAMALHNGTRASCNCFGVVQAPLGRRHIVRNAVLLAVVATAAFATPSPGPIDLGVLAIATVVATVVAVFVVRLDDLADLLFPARSTAPGQSPGK